MAERLNVLVKGLDFVGHNIKPPLTTNYFSGDVATGKQVFDAKALLQAENNSDN